jgi:hypothetical protein
VPLNDAPKYNNVFAKESSPCSNFSFRSEIITGSCAEYHFKPLRRLLSMYIQETTGEVKDLSDISVLFDVLQKNTHIVAQYFDIRTRVPLNDAPKYNNVFAKESSPCSNFSFRSEIIK